MAGKEINLPLNQKKNIQKIEEKKSEDMAILNEENIEDEEEEKVFPVDSKLSIATDVERDSYNFGQLFLLGLLQITYMVY